MTWNNHDPNKPGGYSDWKLHGEKHGNWGSSWGQHGVGSGSTGWSSPRSSSSQSSSSGTSWFSPSSFTPGAIVGGGFGGAGRYVAGGGLVSRLLKLVFVASMLYGAYDSFAHHAGVGETAGRAGGTVYAWSAQLGDRIKAIDPDSTLVSIANGARWVAGAGVAVCVGAGAGVGNAAVWVIRAGLDYIGNHTANSSATAAPIAASSSSQPTTTGSHYATVTAINLNLRDQPDASDPNNIVTTMPQGLHVKVVGHADNGWLELDDVPGAGSDQGNKFHGYASPKGLKED